MANISYNFEVVDNPTDIGLTPIPVAITGLPQPDITPGVAVSDATDDTDVVDQLNDLLASLRDAGFIEE